MAYSLEVSEEVDEIFRNGARRVHIGGSFVLTYEFSEKEKVVRILDFDHHDNVYL